MTFLTCYYCGHTADSKSGELELRYVKGETRIACVNTAACDRREAANFQQQETTQ